MNAIHQHAMRSHPWLPCAIPRSRGLRAFPTRWAARRAPLLAQLSRCILMVAAAMSFLLGTDAQGQAVVQDEPAILRQVPGWIEDLKSENYAARESANRKISRHLDIALPMVIQAAEESPNAGTEYLLQFLGFIAADALTEPGEKAYASLQRIASERTSNRAIVAQKILEGIAVQMRDMAVDRLRTVGITCEDRFLSVLTRTVEVKNALVVDRRFSGNPEDLKLLRWLFDVEFAKLEGPRITPEVLQAISSLPKLNSLQLIETELRASDIQCLTEAPDLKLLEILYTPIDDASIAILEQLPIFGDLQLFGTKISADGAKELVARIDTANVFIGRGGFLGITCEPSSLIIREVVPQGPAYAAGIRTMDRLLSVEGISISNFDELRRELAKFADGEKVIVELERPLISFRRGDDRGNDGQKFDAYSPLRLEVTLGRRPSEMNR